jgi:hypothetical protein
MAEYPSFLQDWQKGNPARIIIIKEVFNSRIIDPPISSKILNNYYYVFKKHAGDTKIISLSSPPPGGWGAGI